MIWWMFVTFLLDCYDPQLYMLCILGWFYFMIWINFRSLIKKNMYDGRLCCPHISYCRTAMAKRVPKNLMLVIQKWCMQIHLWSMKASGSMHNWSHFFMLLCSFDKSCSILSFYLLFCYIVFRLEKRKHKAMSSIPEENGSVEQRKRKREEKQCKCPHP